MFQRLVIVHGDPPRRPRLVVAKWERIATTPVINPVVKLVT